MSTAIPVRVFVEWLKREEDRITFSLDLNVFGVQNAAFACDVVTEFYKHPRVGRYGRDDFRLPADLRQKIALAVYKFLVGYLRDDLCGTVTAVEWNQPDLRPWLDRNFYHHDASRLARLLSAKVKPGTRAPFDRRVISTRHD